MGDGGASKAAKRAAEQSFQSQLMFENQVKEQKAKAARDSEKAQRLMMRGMRGGGGGYFMAAGNNPSLGDASGVLG